MAPRIELIETGTIYANPIPHLVSRQAVFPGLVRLDGDRLLAVFSIGQAFDAADLSAHASVSHDRGRTWSEPMRMTGQSAAGAPAESETYKPLRLADGTIIATGYAFVRPDATTPIVDPVTFDMLPMVNKITISTDEGESWSPPRTFSVADRPLELSGPPIQLASGRILAAAAPFHLGKVDHEGWVIFSDDGGRSWDRLSTFFRADGGTVAPWECRLCEMKPGRVAVLFWAYDAGAGRNLTNRIALSEDGGESFGAARDTGIAGQAANLMPLDGERVLSIHCHREAPVALTVRLLRMDEAGVAVEAECPLFSSDAMASRTDTIASQFASLRFGQPGLVELPDGEVLATCWQVEECQHVIKSYRLGLAF